MIRRDPDFLGSGWAFPVRTQGQDIALVAGNANIEQSIRIILGTAKGERAMRPDFGCDLFKLVFESNQAATGVAAERFVEEALSQWEPRIEDIEVTSEIAQEEPTRLDITVRYRVRGSNAVQNLVYPFYLEQ